jgi:Carotenoid biosynthesis protein
MLEHPIYSFSGRFAPLLGQELLYSLLQLGVLLAFLTTAVRASRISFSRLRELFTAFVFGLLLEEGDIIIFGTYSYDRHWIAIGYVPIAIAMSWAMIIASAMSFSDTLGLPGADSLPHPRSRRGVIRWLAYGSLAPAADALWAIILDLSLDAVAIRLRLWTWRIPLDQGWFGVPWGNFYSWLFVAAMFSFFTRLIRSREAERGAGEGRWQLLVPFLAYGGLLTSLVPFILIQATVFASDRQNTAPIFLIALTAFIILTSYGLWTSRMRPRNKLDQWLIVVRGAIHLTFLAALILTGIFVRLPVLLGVALAMLVVELVLTALLRRANAGLTAAQPIRVQGESVGK